MKCVVATVLLWTVAVFGTPLIVNDIDRFTYLGPLYAVCMIGSLIVVRLALREPGP